MSEFSLANGDTHADVEAETSVGDERVALPTPIFANTSVGRVDSQDTDANVHRQCANCRWQGVDRRADRVFEKPDDALTFALCDDCYANDPDAQKLPTTYQQLKELTLSQRWDIYPIAVLFHPVYLRRDASANAPTTTDNPTGGANTNPAAKSRVPLAGLPLAGLPLDGPPLAGLPLADLLAKQETVYNNGFDQLCRALHRCCLLKQTSPRFGGLDEQASPKPYCPWWCGQLPVGAIPHSVRRIAGACLAEDGGDLEIVSRNPKRPARPGSWEDYAQAFAATATRYRNTEVACGDIPRLRFLTGLTQCTLRLRPTPPPGYEFHNRCVLRRRSNVLQKAWRWIKKMVNKLRPLPPPRPLELYEAMGKALSAASGLESLTIRVETLPQLATLLGAMENSRQLKTLTVISDEDWTPPRCAAHLRSLCDRLTSVTTMELTLPRVTGDFVWALCEMLPSLSRLSVNARDACGVDMQALRDACRDLDLLRIREISFGDMVLC